MSPVQDGGAGPPTAYTHGTPSDPSALAAKHRLANILRDLIETCTTLDAMSAGAEMLDEVSEVLGTVRDRLAACARLDPGTWTPETSLVERGPYTGSGNPLAAPLHLSVDGELTRAWAVYNHSYEGGAGDMRGGAVIAAFDDLLGCAQMVGAVSGRTGTLSVRLRAPSPIGQRVDYVARLDRVEGFKAFCSGQAWCGDYLLAEAEAIFVTPRDRRNRS